MAFFSGEDLTHLFFDGLDVKASNDALDIEWEALTETKRIRGAEYPALFVTGQKTGTMSYDGWYDGTTAAQLADRTGDAKIISVLHEGNTYGAHFFGMQQAYISGTTFSVPEEGIDRLTPALTADGALDYGFVVATVVSRGAASNTQANYVDLGAASATGGRLYMNISAIAVGGGSGVTVTLQHSTDHVSWADHAGGALTIANAVGAQCKDITTAVNQYLAMRWQWTGGAAQSFTAFVGFAPN